MAELSGRRIVEMVERTCGRRAFSAAKRSTTPSRYDMAIGGSTNAVVHLIAIAGRLGIELTLDEFDASRGVLRASLT